MLDDVSDLVIKMMALMFGLMIIPLVLLAITGFGSFEFGLDVGQGEQVGYISEIENNGFIWQPTDVRLISVEPTFSQMDTAWHYGVINEEVTEKARRFMNTHEKVVVKYETHMFEGRWDYSHRTIITDILSAV